MAVAGSAGKVVRLHKRRALQSGSIPLQTAADNTGGSMFDAIAVAAVAKAGQAVGPSEPVKIVQGAYCLALQNSWNKFGMLVLQQPIPTKSE